jgi:hypothetical protein
VWTRYVRIVSFAPDRQLMQCALRQQGQLLRVMSPLAMPKPRPPPFLHLVLPQLRPQPRSRKGGTCGPTTAQLHLSASMTPTQSEQPPKPSATARRVLRATGSSFRRCRCRFHTLLMRWGLKLAGGAG